MLWLKASPLDLDLGLCDRAKLFNIGNRVDPGGQILNVKIDKLEKTIYFLKITETFHSTFSRKTTTLI